MSRSSNPTVDAGDLAPINLRTTHLVTRIDMEFNKHPSLTADEIIRDHPNDLRDATLLVVHEETGWGGKELTGKIREYHGFNHPSFHEDDRPLRNAFRIGVKNARVAAAKRERQYDLAGYLKRCEPCASKRILCSKRQYSKSKFFSSAAGDCLQCPALTCVMSEEDKAWNDTLMRAKLGKMALDYSTPNAATRAAMRRVAQTDSIIVAASYIPKLQQDNVAVARAVTPQAALRTATTATSVIQPAVTQSAAPQLPALRMSITHPATARPSVSEFSVAKPVAYPAAVTQPAESHPNPTYSTPSQWKARAGPAYAAAVAAVAALTEDDFLHEQDDEQMTEEYDDDLDEY